MDLSDRKTITSRFIPTQILSGYWVYMLAGIWVPELV